MNVELDREALKDQVAQIQKQREDEAKEESKVSDEQKSFQRAIIQLCRMDTTTQKRGYVKDCNLLKTGLQQSRNTFSYPCVDINSDHCKKVLGSSPSNRSQDLVKVSTSIQILKAEIKKSDMPLQLAFKIAQNYMLLDLPLKAIPFFLAASKESIPLSAIPSATSSVRNIKNRKRTSQNISFEEKEKPLETQNVSKEYTRRINAHLALIRLNLGAQNYAAATAHLEVWLELSTYVSNRHEKLIELNKVLCQLNKSYLKNQNKINGTHKSVSNFRDVHIEIVKEILQMEKETTNPNQNGALERIFALMKCNPSM